MQLQYPHKCCPLTFSTPHPLPWRPTASLNWSAAASRELLSATKSLAVGSQTCPAGRAVAVPGSANRRSAAARELRRRRMSRAAATRRRLVRAARPGKAPNLEGGRLGRGCGTPGGLYPSRGRCPVEEVVRHDFQRLVALLYFKGPQCCPSLSPAKHTRPKERCRGSVTVCSFPRTARRGRAERRIAANEDNPRPQKHVSPPALRP